MNVIPDGWARYRIKDLVTKLKNPVKVNESETYREIGIRSHGKGIFYKESITGRELGNKSVFWIEPNCFIVNIVFAWELAVAKTTENELGFIASHRFPMYKPIENKVNIDFFTYLFKSSRGKNLLNIASPGGAGRNKTLGQKNFEELEVVIPSNVEEQRIIAEILSTWDRAIELKEKLIEQKKNQKTGLMQKLLTGKIRVPNFSGDWKKHDLGQLGKPFNGLVGKTADDFGEGKPYIPYKTIFSDSKIDLNKLDYVFIDDNETQNKVQYGDVFFTTSSETPQEVGMSSVLLDDIKEVYLNSFCFGYRLNNFDVLHPEFARFLFRGEEFKRKVYVLAQGSTRFNLSKKEMMKINLSMPNINEQKAIASILSDAEKEIKTLLKQVEVLKLQKNGLMQVLLTGKVRVKV